MRQEKNSYFSLVNERREQTRSSGFTLIELLVVLAIITVIMGIVFSSQSSFNKTLILTNTAYDIALTLRDAESYGLGSRAATGGVSNAGYGVDFQSASPGQFTFFADTYPAPSASGSACHPNLSGDASSPTALPGDCTYEPSTTQNPNFDQKVTSYTLGNGITVSDFCIPDAGGNEFCKVHNGLTWLDVVFSRPNPSAFIRAGVGSFIDVGSSACITLTSPQGGFRYVSIASSGEITANAASCP